MELLSNISVWGLLFCIGLLVLDIHGYSESDETALEMVYLILFLFFFYTEFRDQNAKM